jgi:hypothetical protein
MLLPTYNCYNVTMCITDIPEQKTELSCKVCDQSNMESNIIGMAIEKLCSRWNSKTNWKLWLHHLHNIYSDQE